MWKRQQFSLSLIAVVMRNKYFVWALTWDIQRQMDDRLRGQDMRRLWNLVPVDLLAIWSMAMVRAVMLTLWYCCCLAICLEFSAFLDYQFQFHKSYTPTIRMSCNRYLSNSDALDKPMIELPLLRPLLVPIEFAVAAENSKIHDGILFYRSRDVKVHRHNSRRKQNGSLSFVKKRNDHKTYLLLQFGEISPRLTQLFLLLLLLLFYLFLLFLATGTSGSTRL